MVTYEETAALTLFGRSLLAVVGAVAGLYLFAQTATQSFIYNGVGVGVAAAMFIGVLHFKAEPRSAWLLLAFGMTLSTTGDILYGISSVAPSPSDMSYVAAYPLFALGLSGISRRSEAARRSTKADVATITASIGIMAVVFLFVPLLGSGSGGAAGAAIAVGYPLMDLALIRLAIRGSRTDGTVRSPMLFLAVGFVLMLVADVGFAVDDFGGSYKVGSLLDPLWLAAYACFGAAALHQVHSQALWPPAVHPKRAGSEMDRYVRAADARARAAAQYKAPELGNQALRFRVVLRGVGSALMVLGALAMVFAFTWHEIHLVMLAGTYSGVGLITSLSSRFHA
jgi:hypothetical protein